MADAILGLIATVGILAVAIISIPIVLLVVRSLLWRERRTRTRTFPAPPTHW